MMEAVFRSVQCEGVTEHYASQVLTLDLSATVVWHNIGRQPNFPRDTENKDTLWSLLEVFGPVQQA